MDLTGLLISYCDVVRNDFCVTTCSIANWFVKNAEESCLELLLGTFWNPWIHRSGREARTQGRVKCLQQNGRLLAKLNKQRCVFIMFLFV